MLRYPPTLRLPLISLTLCLCSQAYAQAEPAPSPAETKAPATTAASDDTANDPQYAEAKKYFERGVQFFDAENYDAALTEFERAYAHLKGHPKRFFVLNSLDDLIALRRRRAECGGRARWAVIGGGLIGCEVASDLQKAGDAVTILHREARLLERQLTEPQSCALHEHFAARKVEIHYNQDVRDIPPSFDGVIVSAGFAPRVALAQKAGLATHRGIQVNEYLCTDDPGIYAVGDVAEIGTRLYPFVSPIRSQALWLAEHLEGHAKGGWTSPAFTPVIKIHDFKLPEKANTASDAK